MEGKVVKQFGEKYLDYNKSKDDKLPPGLMESLIYEGKVVGDGKYVYYVNFCFGHVFKYSSAGEKLAQFKLEFKEDKKRELILAKNLERLKKVSGIVINKDGSVMSENWHIFRDVILFKGRLYGLAHVLRTKEKVDPGLAVNNFDILVFDTQSFKLLEKHEIKFGKDDELQSFAMAGKQGKRVLLVAMSDEEGNGIVEYSLD